MKNNTYYLYLLSRINKIAEFQDGMNALERLDKELLFNVLFMTINRLASKIAKKDGYCHSLEVTNACIVLTYTDIKDITALIIKEPVILNYKG